MDLADKLANNEQLSAQELQQLKQSLKNLDVLSSWIGADGKPRLTTFSADEGSFLIMPIGGSDYWVWPQVISSGTAEFLDPISSSGNGNDSMVIPSKTSTSRLDWNLRFKDAEAVGLATGIIIWEGNANGTRYVDLEWYNISDDTLSSGYRIMYAGSPPAIETNYFFSVPVSANNSTYLKIRAYQNSGSELDFWLDIIFFAIR